MKGSYTQEILAVSLPERDLCDNSQEVNMVQDISQLQNTHWLLRKGETVFSRNKNLIVIHSLVLSTKYMQH